MKIIGWIREGDKAACGGVVAEAHFSCMSYGRALSYEGAAIACRKNCHAISRGHRASLPNGREMLIHGDITTGGCPLISTINDIHGIDYEGGAAVPEEFFQSPASGWVAGPGTPTPLEYDEQVQFSATGNAALIGLPYYVETLDGRTFSGRAGADGLLLRVGTYGADEYAVYWGDEALARMAGSDE